MEEPKDREPRSERVGVTERETERKGDGETQDKRKKERKINKRD